MRHYSYIAVSTILNAFFIFVIGTIYVSRCIAEEGLIMKLLNIIRATVLVIVLNTALALFVVGVIRLLNKLTEKNK